MANLIKIKFFNKKMIYASKQDANLAGGGVFLNASETPSIITRNENGGLITRFAKKEEIDAFSVEYGKAKKVFETVELAKQNGGGLYYDKNSGVRILIRNVKDTFGYRNALPEDVYKWSELYYNTQIQIYEDLTEAKKYGGGIYRAEDGKYRIVNVAEDGKYTNKLAQPEDLHKLPSRRKFTLEEEANAKSKNDKELARIGAVEQTKYFKELEIEEKRKQREAESRTNFEARKGGSAQVKLEKEIARESAHAQLEMEKDKKRGDIDQARQGAHTQLEMEREKRHADMDQAHAGAHAQKEIEYEIAEMERAKAERKEALIKMFIPGYLKMWKELKENYKEYGALGVALPSLQGVLKHKNALFPDKSNWGALEKYKQSIAGNNAPTSTGTKRETQETRFAIEKTNDTIKETNTLLDEEIDLQDRANVLLEDIKEAITKGGISKSGNNSSVNGSMMKSVLEMLAGSSIGRALTSTMFIYNTMEEGVKKLPIGNTQPYHWSWSEMSNVPDSVPEQPSYNNSSSVTGGFSPLTATGNASPVSRGNTNVLTNIPVNPTNIVPATVSRGNTNVLTNTPVTPTNIVPATNETSAIVTARNRSMEEKKNIIKFNADELKFTSNKMSFDFEKITFRAKNIYGLNGVSSVSSATMGNDGVINIGGGVAAGGGSGTMNGGGPGTSSKGSVAAGGGPGTSFKGAVGVAASGSSGMMNGGGPGTSFKGAVGENDNTQKRSTRNQSSPSGSKISNADQPSYTSPPTTKTSGGQKTTTYQNKQLFLKAMNDAGIKDPEMRAAMAAVAEGESHFTMHTEQSYAKTSNDRIRRIFGAKRFAGLSDAQLTELKSNPEAFFNKVYGGILGNAADEGYKYRGRGYIQLTGKSNYEKYGKAAGIDIVTHPELMEDPNIAAKVALAYMKDRTLHNRGSTYENVARGVGKAVAETEPVKIQAMQKYMNSGEFGPDKTPDLKGIEIDESGMVKKPNGGSKVSTGGSTPDATKTLGDVPPRSSFNYKDFYKEVANFRGTSGPYGNLNIRGGENAINNYGHLCGVGVSNAVGVLFADPRFKIVNGMHAGSFSMAGNNNTFQSSGLYEEKQPINFAEWKNRPASSVPPGTIVAGGSVGGKQHIQISDGKNWISDTVQSSIYLNASEAQTAAVHYPTAQALSRLPKEIIQNSKIAQDVLSNAKIDWEKTAPTKKENESVFNGAPVNDNKKTTNSGEKLPNSTSIPSDDNKKITNSGEKLPNSTSIPSDGNKEKVNLKPEYKTGLQKLTEGISNWWNGSPSASSDKLKPEPPKIIAPPPPPPEPAVVLSPTESAPHVPLGDSRVPDRQASNDVNNHDRDFKTVSPSPKDPSWTKYFPHNLNSAHKYNDASAHSATMDVA